MDLQSHSIVNQWATKMKIERYRFQLLGIISKSSFFSFRNYSNEVLSMNRGDI